MRYVRASLWRVLILGVVSATPVALAAEEMQPLFDGETLGGWTVKGKGSFTFESGAVKGTSESKSFLVTEKEYGDFILELETLVESGGNSGIQFRSHAEPSGRVFGYQAEIDTSPRAWSGGLYDEGRRAWLNPLKDRPEAQSVFKNGQWNRYRVACAGDQLRIWVNGILTTDYRDPVDLTGIIGLQHHGEKGKVYRWKDVRILDLGKSSWEPLWNGKDLDGWTSNGAGAWTVEDGVLVGKADAQAKHGLLFSKEKYADFTVRFRFKSLKGNSGFYFRVEKDESDVACAGFQAEIDPQNDVGGLYETLGRAWVVQPKPEEVKKWYKPGDWNEMVVSAHGRWIVVHVNGTKTAELRDDPGRTEGYLGFQLHGGQEMHVMYKDIQILRVPEGNAAKVAKNP
jgi:hypothetical protein